MNGVTLWVPLQNTTKKNGALKVIPKSHKNYQIFNHSSLKSVKKNKLDKCFEESDFKSINVKLGQALIFSNYLVHKSGNNSSNQIRMSFNVRFNDLLNKEYIKRGLSFDKLPDTKIKNL
jgi:phytanoyl-CoA hydroxylase